MHFRFYPVYIFLFGLFALHSHAAELLLPASSVSVAVPLPSSAVSFAAPAADKTVYIEADQIEGDKNDRMEAHGNAQLQQGDQKIFSDHLFFDQKTGDITGNGAVRVEQPGGKASGPAFKMNMDSSVGEMNGPIFQFKENNARGSAEVMHKSGKLNYEFEHAKYTTCPAGNDDWYLKMSRLDIDQTTQIGTAHNAWVEFKGVPLLYTPWMDFPLDGRRRSGFLGPVFGVTTSGGAEITTPFYWNIAANYDATIAPRRITKRGILINDEFRYMGSGYMGEMHYDILPNDHIANVRRTHSTLKHSQNLGGGFGATLNFNRVSDDAYFRDLSTTVLGGTQTQLLNEGVLSYGGGWWSASMRGQTYQTLQDPLAPVGVPYFRLPQLNVSAQQKVNDAQMNLISEYVSFRHNDPSVVNGQRMVFYPSIAYSLINDPGYYLKPKLGIHSTRYLMGANYAGDYADTSRTLPIFSLDGGLIFERDVALGKGGYIQTLEPRAYYVKIPYQNQDFLPVFDTSQAGFNFSQMFTENRFYGNDRVGDANMMTVALTSRLIDNTGGVERLRVALGERFSYEAPLVNLVAPDANSRSNILLAVGGRATNALTVDSLVEYDPNTQHTLSYNASTRYKPETGKVLNLGYRYTRVGDIPENDVRQAEFSTQWPLFWHWYAVSRFSYTFQDLQVLEALAGLEYNQSCWMLRLVAQRFPTATQQVSTGIFVQLELNDLIALGGDPLSALRQSIPGYSKLNAR